MRSIVRTAVALLTSLALAATLPAQVKQPEITTRPPGTMSRMETYNGKTLPQWIKEVENPDPGLAENAIRAVATYGPDAAKEANPALIKALGSYDTGVRVNAALALTLMGVDESHVKDAVPALAKRLTEDTQAIVRLHAAVTLGRMDLDAQLAIPELARAAKDPSAWEIRRAAVFALGRAGRATEKRPLDFHAAQTLIYLISGSPDRCAEVRLMAVQQLGALGIPPTPADKQAILQALTHATGDRYKAVGIWAHVGLMADGEPQQQHLPAILKFLTSSDFESHLQAIRALGTMGKSVASAKGDLLKELKGNNDPVLVAAACWALGEIGDASDTVVKALTTVRDGAGADDSVRNAAKDALDKLSGAAKPGTNGTTGTK